MTDNEDHTEDEGPDEFSIQHVDAETAQEIIDWAASSAGVIILMDTVTNPGEDEEARRLALESLIGGVNMMLNNMPDVLMDVGIEIASNSLVRQEEEDRQVEEFRKELDEL